MLPRRLAKWPPHDDPTLLAVADLGLVTDEQVAGSANSPAQAEYVDVAALAT